MAEIKVNYIKVVALPDPPYVANNFYLLLNGNNCDQYLATADGSALKPVINTPVIQSMINTALSNVGTGGGTTITIDDNPTIGHTANAVSSNGVAVAINSTNSNVGTLSGQVGGLSTQVTNLGTSVGTLNNNVNTLGTTVSTLSGQLGNKVDKSGSKVLTTNDYDDTEKTKVANAATHGSIVNGNPHGTTAAMVGLGSVFNLDYRNPNNISWDNSRGTITSTERAAWNLYSTSKQDKLTDNVNLCTINGHTLQDGSNITIGSGVSINDTAASGSSVYSSNKVVALLTGKRDTGTNILVAEVTFDSAHQTASQTEKDTWNAASGSGADFWLSAKIVGSAVGNGTTDDSTAFNAMLTSNKIVYIPTGTYKLASAIALSNISNLKIIGSKNSKFTGTIKTLLSLTNCTNIEILDIIFECTTTDTTGGTADTTNGLIKINGGTSIKISDNTFNATAAITNGIRVIVDDTHVVSGLKITRNTFDGIGQRAIEVGSSVYVNKNFADSSINNNNFNNTGTKTATNGQAICIRAYSTRIKVEGNEVRDAGGTGMEFDGIESLSLTSNDMYSVNKAFQPYRITKGVTAKSTTNLILNHGVINVRGTEAHSTIIEDVSKFSIKNCTFIAGMIKIKGDSGNVSNNSIFSDEDRCIYIETASSKNFFNGNILDNTAGSTPLEPVLTDGSGVVNNVFSNNPYFTATGNSAYVFGSGSSNNVFINQGF